MTSRHRRSCLLMSMGDRSTDSPRRTALKALGESLVRISLLAGRSSQTAD